MVSVKVTTAEVGAAEQINDGLKYISRALDAVDTYSLFTATENSLHCKVSLME